MLRNLGRFFFGDHFQPVQAIWTIAILGLLWAGVYALQTFWGR